MREADDSGAGHGDSCLVHQKSSWAIKAVACSIVARHLLTGSGSRGASKSNLSAEGSMPSEETNAGPCTPQDPADSAALGRCLRQPRISHGLLPHPIIFRLR